MSFKVGRLSIKYNSNNKCVRLYVRNFFATTLLNHYTTAILLLAVGVAYRRHLAYSRIAVDRLYQN